MLPDTDEGGWEGKHLRQCHGLTRNLNWCQRTGDWRWFCPEHRKQPIVWATFLVFTIVAGIASIRSGFFTSTEHPAPTAVQTINDGQAAITDNAEATILSMVTTSGTNGNPLVRIEMAIRNEGSRPIMIRQVLLGLSETPSFDLPIYHAWNQEDALVVDSRRSLLTRMVFGQASTNHPMILARGFDEPPIYARLIVDVIGSDGHVHRIQQDAFSLQFAPDLHIEWKHSPPWDIALLPSDGPPPYLSLDSKPNAVEMELKIVNGQIQQVTNDGPLNWRLQGTYTNDIRGPWSVRPWTNAEVYRRVKPYRVVASNVVLRPGTYDVQVPSGSVVVITHADGPATGALRRSKTRDQVMEDILWEANKAREDTVRRLADPQR